MKKWFTARSIGRRRGEVFIYDDIGAFGLRAKDLIEQLGALGEIDVLDVRINSFGGDVFDGLAIYHALQRHPARVEVTVDGLAASIASVIAMAGDEIAMPSNAWMMIHDPSAFVVGTSGDMTRMAETLDGIKRSLINIYVRRTGKPDAEISALMAAETWMDGQAAVDAGFATLALEAEAVAASADPGVFRHVPGPAQKFLGRGESAAPQPAMSEEIAMADDVTAPAAEPKPEQKSETRRERLVEKLTQSAVGAHQPPQKPGQWMRTGAGEQESPENGPLTKADVEKRATEIANRRIAKIESAYRAGRNLGLEAEAQALLDEGIDPDEVPEILIEVRAKRDKQASVVQNMVPSGARVGFSHDDPTVVRERMSDAIASQYIPSMKCPEPARQYLSFRPQDMMRDILERKGVATRHLTRSEIVDAALHTTSDFPELLGTAANKIFMGSYEVAPATFRAIAGRQDLSNFQIHNLLRDGDFPTLKEVMESGEFTYGTMLESKETAQLKTHGRTFAVSRHVLVNDTLGVFGRMVAKIGQAVARFENKTVWRIVTDNAKLADGKALFHADHGNLAGTGAAITATTIGAARTAMRLQKNLDGDVLNVSPSVLATPAAKETVAEQTLSPLYMPTAATDAATQTMRTIQIVAEPLLDPASGTAWYLFSDPAMGAAIVYGYLEGEAAPRVRTNDPFNVDGIEFQVRLDFYAAPVDYRYAFKNPGA